MNKIKIVYIVSKINYSGPINILFGILRNLDKSKFEITILTLSNAEDDIRLKEANELEARVINVSLRGLKNTFLGEKLLREQLDKLKPDIIHSHGFRGDIYNLIYRKAIGITTIHNYPHIDYVMQYGYLVGNIMSIIQLYIIKKMKISIACSYSIAKEIKDKFNIKMAAIANGIDINKFSDENIDKETLKNKLNIGNKKVVVSSGVLIERKNPHYLLKEYMKSHIKNDYILIILGDGDLKASCEELACKEEGVVFLGNVTNVKEYLVISDLFISASKAEGLPNAVLEAMACSVPVLLSSIEPHREILGSTEIHGGNLFELKEGELTKLLNSIDNMDLVKMGENAREIVMKEYTDKVMGAQYQKVYIDAYKDRESINN